MSEFEGKVVVVTGGGTGIGKATAIQFAKLGARVAITGRREDVLQETLKEIGDQGFYVVGDVSKFGDPKRIVSEIMDKYSQIDVLVNNAGTFTMSPLSEIEDAEFERVFKVNVLGPLAMSRECLSALSSQKGAIINVSTIMSKAVMPGSAIYSSSKAALDHITRILAAELGVHGVRVNGVAPGLTETDMTAGILADGESVKSMVSQTALGRLGQPDDIAGSIVSLARDENRWVTGQIIQSSGGMHIV